jgi:hypothetical protein
MAKTRTVSIIRSPAPRAAAPIVVVPSPQRRSTGGRRRSSSKGRRHGRARRFAGSQNTKDVMMKVAIGGAAYALLEKEMPSFPTVPVLGRAGTVALGAYLLGGKKAGLARDLAIASSVIAAYQFLKDGKIAGDDDEHTAGDDE